MKKRAMKKWIPKNTLYCGNCKWRKFIKIIYYNKDERNCPHTDTCDSGIKNECWTSGYNSCQVRVYGCKYLGYTDWKQNSLLWDGCKECDTGYPLI